MESIKIFIDILKYKITLFATTLSAGIYLLINKVILLEVVNVSLLYIISVVLIGYGVTGFVVNILDLNSIKNKIKKDIK